LEDTYAIIRKHKWKIVATFGLAAFLIFAMTFLIGFNDVISTLEKAVDTLKLHIRRSHYSSLDFTLENDSGCSGYFP